MSLNEKINKDLSISMKAGDSLRTETLRSIRASLIEYSKRGAEKTITPEEELQILSTASKKRKEAIEEYKKANRLELAEKEEKELAIISEYLPKQLTKDEVIEIIKSIIYQVGAKSSSDFGKVMPLAMKELKGKTDGKMVQELVKNLLS